MDTQTMCGQDINRVSSFSRCHNGIFPWKNCSVNTWCINTKEKSNKYKSSLLSRLTKALTEHFLQGNVPLRHLLNAKLPFMSWWRSALNEVNDWALDISYLPFILFVYTRPHRYYLVSVMVLFSKTNISSHKISFV